MSNEAALQSNGPTDYAVVVELLALNAYQSYRSALTAANRGYPIRFDRISKPQFGDLVLETTRGVLSMMRGQWDEHGRSLGWMHPPQKKGYDCMIEALDGTLTDWENASFVTVLTPELDRELREAERADMDRRADALRKAGI